MAEGSVWEAIMSSAKYKLDNLIAIIDVNGLQAEGYTKESMPIEPFEDKLASFGWKTMTIDGNDIQQIYKALSSVPFRKDQPTCIIANTIKGKGMCFAESNIEYHNWTPDEKSCEEAIISIENNRKRELEKVEK
jgi:transketolase